MEKKLYWLIEDNADMSIVCDSPEQCIIQLECNFDSLNKDEQEETEYTITPVWYTHEEYLELGES